MLSDFITYYACAYSNMLESFMKYEGEKTYDLLPEWLTTEVPSYFMEFPSDSVTQINEFLINQKTIDCGEENENDLNHLSRENALLYVDIRRNFDMWIFVQVLGILHRHCDFLRWRNEFFFGNRFRICCRTRSTHSICLLCNL